MFRASPWINYTAGSGDMDAPEISTLPQETTPPPAPQPAAQSKFRVRLRVTAQKTSSAQSSQPDPESEDDDDEEDQLIDDDDLGQPPPFSQAAPARSKSAPLKPRATKKKGKHPIIAKHSAPEPSSMMTAWQAEVPPSSTQWETVIPSKPSAKRKAPAKKAATVPRQPRKSPTKHNKFHQTQDDPGSASEALPLTVTSSPFPFRGEPPSPHPIPHSGGPIQPAGLDDFSLDAPQRQGTPVAVPVYPHPTRPFAVQPAPKLATGQAPTIPLDRSGAKVRRWEVAHREIKGIAGGRWFARSWVGTKSSEFAEAASTFPIVRTHVNLPPALTTAAPAARKKKELKPPLSSRMTPSIPASTTHPSLTFMQPQTGPGEPTVEIAISDTFLPTDNHSAVIVDSDVEMVPHNPP